MSTPFDPGLQPERTLLAWRRTCLALAVASTTAARFAAETIGAAAIMLGLTGVGLSAWAYLASATRHGHTHSTLTRTGAAPPAGLPILALTGVVVLLGMACVLYLLG